MFYRPDKIKKLHNKWSPYFKNAMVWNLLLSNALSMFLECVLGSAKLLHKNNPFFVAQAESTCLASKMSYSWVVMRILFAQ